MRVLHFLGLILYVGYLVHAGLAMILLPWSPLWEPLLIRIPPAAAAALDLPVLRGAISGFGAVHILLVATELLVVSPTTSSQETP